MVEFFTNVQNLLSLGVGVLVFATLVTLLGSFSGGAKLENRLKAVALQLLAPNRDSLQPVFQLRPAAERAGQRHQGGENQHAHAEAEQVLHSGEEVDHWRRPSPRT